MRKLEADKTAFVFLQWLDAQKIEGDTSSFCKVLKYLIDEHGNSFTVFHVYDTFRVMGSAAREVLWKAWPGKFY